MKIFLAGASGAIGHPLVRALRAAGHDVDAMTRTPEKAGALEELGARAVVCDALDTAAVHAAVGESSPEVVINQLTALPKEYDIRNIDYGPTNRMRGEGGRNMIEAAIAAGAKRFITQSIAFLYAPEGDWVKDEDGKPWEDAPEPFHSAVHAMLGHERAVLASGMGGVVLRYGQFYGPGTYYAPDGSIAAQVKKRRFPLVGKGEGRSSFLHVDDAAAATVAALDRGAPGIYNVVDDEPAPFRDWLPLYAEALGAKRPRKVPVWVARLAAGKVGAQLATALRGASNAKVKRELGWEPRWASWRDGFREALG